MEHLLPAGHSSMHSRVLGPGGWGAEGGSGEGANDQDAVKPGAAKSALFPVTSFLDGLALSPPPQRLHRLAVWTGPAGEAFLDVVCCTHHDEEQRSPSGFMVGIYQINHTTDQRRTKSRETTGKVNTTPPPNPGSWNKSQIPTGCSATSDGELSHRCLPQCSFSSFLFESQGYRRLSPMETGTPRVSSLAPFTNQPLAFSSAQIHGTSWQRGCPYVKVDICGLWVARE